MLPPLPEKLPPKAEPGKPLYARKAPPRQRPVIDKREMEGERKLHPTRVRQGSGRGAAAAAAVIAPPEPRPPREVTITEGITIRELAEKLDVRAKDLLKTLLTAACLPASTRRSMCPRRRRWRNPSMAS